MSMKLRFVKNIVFDIGNKYPKNKTKRNGEFTKLMTFIRKSDYFKGYKKKAYSIILKEKNK